LHATHVINRFLNPGLLSQVASSDLAMGARAKARCLLVYAEASISQSEQVLCRSYLLELPQVLVAQLDTADLLASRGEGSARGAACQSVPQGNGVGGGGAVGGECNAHVRTTGKMPNWGGGWRGRLAGSHHHHGCGGQARVGGDISAGCLDRTRCCTAPPLSRRCDSRRSARRIQ
jgi:hypothetical protein